MVLPPRKNEVGIFREIWRQCNLLRDYCASLRPCPGKNIRINHSSQGTMLSAEFAGSEGGGTVIVPMRIKSIGYNALKCVKWDGGTPETEEIEVARPWLQRQYVYQSDTELTITTVSEQEVTATDGTTTETWKITRAYRIGDMIMAGKVTTVSDIGTWEWVDMNNDGRDWAKTA